MSVGQGVPIGMAVQAPSTPLQEELSHLDAQQDRMQSLLEGLYQKLDPVLGPEIPQPSPGEDSETSEGNSALVNRLSNIVYVAQGANIRLANLLDRLEI